MGPYQARSFKREWWGPSLVCDYRWTRARVSSFKC